MKRFERDSSRDRSEGRNTWARLGRVSALWLWVVVLGCPRANAQSPEHPMPPAVEAQRDVKGRGDKRNAAGTPVQLDVPPGYATEPHPRHHAHDESTDDGEPHVTPFVFPAYTPELGLLFAAGAIVSFKTDPSDPKLPRSSLPLDVGVSTTKAFVSYSQITTFWLHDRLRIYGTLWGKRMPYHYFGVGYQNGRNTALEEDVTSYLKVWWQLNPSFMLRMARPGLYAGPVIDINQMVAKRRGTLFETDPYFQRFGANNYNGGTGLAVQYDTRDVPVNAYSGIYADARALFYGPHLGSHNDYQVVQLDYRQYQSIGPEGSRLAWQVKLRTSHGAVPYNELSHLGTPFDLRGYYWGRYRDRAMLFGLVEYRFMQRRDDSSFWRDIFSRNGFAAWVGTGSIAPRVVKLRHWLPNGGIGYRLEVQPRLNVRLDAGFGLESWAVYFNMNEAF